MTTPLFFKILSFRVAEKGKNAKILDAHTVVCTRLIL